MKQSGYLKRQADVQDSLLKIGTEVGQQDRLDRALKDVFGGDLQPFAERYPYIKEQKYGRKQ